MKILSPEQFDNLILDIKAAFGEDQQSANPHTIEWWQSEYPAIAPCFAGWKDIEDRICRIRQGIDDTSIQTEEMLAGCLRIAQALAANMPPVVKPLPCPPMDVLADMYFCAPVEAKN